MKLFPLVLIALLCSSVYGFTGGCTVKYNGHKQLCIYDVRKAETCLNYSNTTTYDCDADYKALLREPPQSITRVTQVFTGTLPGTLLVVGLSIFPLIFLVWIVWRLIL